MSARRGSGSLLAERENDLTDERIEAALQSFEGSLPFRMTAEQREAVMGAVEIASGDHFRGRRNRQD